MSTFENSRHRALALWEQGCRCHDHSDYTRAIELYRESISVCPTAEAHTFLGWTYSALNRVDDAIVECHRAIGVDPEYGNAYNDIGAYLLSRGELDQAIPWFARAKAAPRYEPRHFPFLNLGRVYLAKGNIARALAEFRGALELAPADRLASAAVAEIRRRLN